MMRDYWEEPEIKKVNKRKVIISIIVILILMLIITLIVFYNVNNDVKKWIDKNLLNKEVLQNNTTTIELEDENAKVYAFNNHIGILNKNKLTIYNNFGNNEVELTMEITNPIFNSSNRFLAIGENGGQKLYVVEDKKIAWETEVEGNISQIHINKNGYVAIVITGTSHKSVISVYDTKGKNLFNKYLASTRLADVSISNDNRYLALAEIDTSGTIIQSNIKIISIEKAQSDPNNSQIKTYSGKANSLITNIKYQEKDKLVCMYDDSIHVISNDQDEIISDNTNKKISFSSIELSNNVVDVEEKSSGLFTADSIVSIINTDNKNVNTYTAQNVTKVIYTYENIIALNLGAEVEFINTDGWLVKRYVANQEITNMVVSSSIAGIVYRDKVEIINL